MSRKNEKNLKNLKSKTTYCVVLLLIATSFAVADTDEEQAVEAEAPEKSPIKIGGAMRANYVYGTYTDGRGDDNGDVDLEILRVNADLDFHNIIGRLEYRWYPRWFGASSGYSIRTYAFPLKVPLIRGIQGVKNTEIMTF